MCKRWLLCVFTGALAWGQAAPPAAQPSPNTMIGRPRQEEEAPASDTAASVADTAAVITVKGVCPPRPKPAAAKTAAAKPAAAGRTAASKPAPCQTVVTKAEFELLLKAVAPNPNPQVRRQLAAALPRAIGMASEARKQGLDKTKEFDEMMKFWRLQILTTEMQRSIQKKAENISEAELEDYYKKNPEAFELYDLERLYIPRNKRIEPEAKPTDAKDAKLTDEQQKAKEAEEKEKLEASQQEMTKLADDLRDRAAKGEAFETLQQEAFTAAGLKLQSPAVKMTAVRRTGLQPAQAAVFDLKDGDVSQVFSDNNGHYIYKLDSKKLMPFEQAKEEIHATLQNQRMRDLMEKATSRFTVETNEAYFGPPNQPPARMPMPRRPGMPGPAGAGAHSTPPASQAPATPPSASPTPTTQAPASQPAAQAPAKPN
jgi:PPIC-type PPIASE domain